MSKKPKLIATLKKFCGRHHDLVNPYNVPFSRIVSDVFANNEPYVEFKNPGHHISFVQAYGHGGQSLLTKKCLLSADA